MTELIEKDLLRRSLNKQNAVLPADAEKQLHQRIVRLQLVGFGLALNHFRRVCVDTVSRTRGKADWRERADLPFEKEPRLKCKERRTSHL
jgi:hypothetical protein